MLDERKAAILAALVEDYIVSGAPVSSRAILDRSGLDCSSATVRNDLVSLEREGYVSQPHTSAGRIPSPRGYRYYLDHLSKGSLRASTKGRITTFFGTVHDELGRLLRETTDLLSDITNYPSVVIGPALRDHVVRDVHLIPIDAERTLLVVISETGRLHQAVIHPGTPVSDADMRIAASKIAETVVGHHLGASPMPDPAEDVAPAVGRLIDRALAAVLAAGDAGREVYVGGTSRLVELWEDLAKLHRVLAMLERETAVMTLLGDAEGTSVRLGSEVGAGEPDLAVVSSGYGVPVTGRVGVLGPMRMDYRRTISVVEEVSEALGDSLSS